MESDDLIMVYDTETTGKSDFKASWNADHQPCIVQLGYKVYNSNRDVLFEIGHLVNSTVLPQWRGIEPEAYNIHKITEDMILRYGWSPVDSISLFQRWANRCKLFVGHNEDFDNGIVRTHAFRCGWSPDLFQGSRYCTMKSTTHICKIPSPKGFGFKWPKLNEAYPHFFPGESFKNAHNALADVNPTAEIFWKLVDLELVRLTP
jgi:DNA polymerase-3 subunit epsilon